MKGRGDLSALEMLEDLNGHANTDAFFNVCVQYSLSLFPDGGDPGLVKYGKGTGAPFHKPDKGIVRACCSRWNDEQGGCQVSSSRSLALAFVFPLPFF